MSEAAWTCHSSLEPLSWVVRALLAADVAAPLEEVGYKLINMYVRVYLGEIPSTEYF